MRMMMAELTSQQNNPIAPVDAYTKSRTAMSGIKSAIGLSPSQDKLGTAFNNKNPYSLGSFEEQGASVEGKLKRLLNDTRYKNLSPENQDRLRGKLYDQYVAPLFTSAKKPAPDRQTWLKGSHSDEMLNPTNYVHDASFQNLMDFTKGAFEKADKISIFGARLGKAAFLNQYGIGTFFGIPTGVPPTGFGINKMADAAAKNATNTVFDKFIKNRQQAVADNEYWFQTHPRDGFLGGAARWTGEQVAMLPIYTLLGAGGRLFGEAAIAMGTEGSLTDALIAAGSENAEKTALQKLVTRGIAGGFTGLLGSMIGEGRITPTVKDVEEGAGWAATEVVGGAIFDRAGEWLARARGGDFISLNLANDAAIKKWSAEQLAVGGDPLSHASIDAASKELRTTGVEPPPITTGEAPPPKIMSPEVRKTRDPVLHSLIEGDKMSLQSLAIRHYGINYEALPKEFQDKVDQLRLERMEEAKYEMPVHKPELNKAEVEYNLKQQATASPYIAKGMQALKEQFGLDLATVVNDKQIEAVAKQTGISSPIAAAEKAAKIGKTTTTKLGPRPPKAKRISPERFASHKVETVARLKAPFRAVGADINIKNMDTNTFINYLKEADGDFIKFEDPFHRMLFHWGNRKELPTAVRSKLLSEMKLQVKFRKPFQGQEFLSKNFDNYADRGALHLQMLAQSGRLSSDKNMFKSTNLFGAPTKWQTALNTEIDEDELKLLRKTIILHKDSLDTVNGYLKAFQANRADGLINPDQWRDYNQVVNMLLGGELKKARTHALVLGEVYGSVPK